MNATNRLYENIFSWVERHPNARSIPAHIETYIDSIKRYDEVSKADIKISIDKYELHKIEEALSEELPGYSSRREQEHELADYIEQVAHSTFSPDLFSISDSLKNCRLTGTVGAKPGGGHVVAWDHKCGQNRLCPDESREETQRLMEWYQPAIQDWVESHPTHRVFYAVFTRHNYRPGYLRWGKKEIIERFKDFTDKKVEYCPVMFVDGPACEVVTKKRIIKNYCPVMFVDGPACVVDKKEGYIVPGQPIKKTQELIFPNIKGSLVVQEDPLSASGDWNVHLNVFFLVKGAFDWAEVRRRWGANIHIQEIEKKPAALREALIEAIKYAAQIVPTKSEEKRNNNKTEAPAMTEWEHGQWIEWWRAQTGFRRVRSYGVLYALHRKRWEKMEIVDKVKHCMAEEIDTSTCNLDWTDIPEEDRAKLRKAMLYGERLDMSLIQWVGCIRFDGGSYWVDLIPGHNFQVKSSLPYKYSDLDYLDPGGG